MRAFVDQVRRPAGLEAPTPWFVPTRISAGDMVMYGRCLM
uniref:Uncharacterized protein n=1 Tax=Arundo donax TaxID=35708 RepID=A0A0A9AWE0_ARUDO